MGALGDTDQQQQQHSVAAGGERVSEGPAAAARPGVLNDDRVTGDSGGKSEYLVTTGTKN